MFSIQLSWHPRFHVTLIFLSSLPSHSLILQHFCPHCPVIFGAVLILNVILRSATSNTTTRRFSWMCLRIISLASDQPSIIAYFISVEKYGSVNYIMNNAAIIWCDFIFYRWFMRIFHCNLFYESYYFIIYIFNILYPRFLIDMILYIYLYNSYCIFILM